MNIKETLQLLDIQEVTTSRQKKNGTREFKLPVKDQYGGEIHVASFSSGYVRRTKAGGYCPSWQLNKRVESEPQYYGPFENGMYRKYTTRTCKLIPNEQDRLKYLISFCLKNYYIGQANKLSSGEFIPKWKHEHELKSRDAIADVVFPEKTQSVQVIVDGHRYNVI
tara:strand:- start:2951 stop:3448 length:498 start_codon:yes stop_codon:yes gene_type:complete